MSKTYVYLDANFEITHDAEKARLLVVREKDGGISFGISENAGRFPVVNRFRGHRGRPGLVGGSVPRSAGTGPTPSQEEAEISRILKGAGAYEYDPLRMLRMEKSLQSGSYWIMPSGKTYRLEGISHRDSAAYILDELYPDAPGGWSMTKSVADRTGIIALHVEKGYNRWAFTVGREPTQRQKLLLESLDFEKPARLKFEISNGVRLLDPREVIYSNLQTNAFPGHRGRPGQRGGSLPRSAGAGPTPQVAGKKSLVMVGKRYNGAPVYKVENFGGTSEDIEMLSNVAVAITGPHKGTVLIGDSTSGHSAMVDVLDPPDNVDSWVRMSGTYSERHGGFFLESYVEYAGVMGTYTSDEYEGGKFEADALDNIYDAYDILKKKGIPADLPVVAYKHVGLVQINQEQITSRLARWMRKNFVRRQHMGPGDHPSGSSQDVHAGGKDWQGRDIKPDRVLAGGNLTPEEVAIIDLAHENPSARFRKKDVDPDALQFLRSQGVVMPVEKLMKSGDHYYQLTARGHEIKTQLYLVRKRIEHMKQNAFPGHRGRPGQRGGSLPRSAGTGPTPKAEGVGDRADEIVSQIADDFGYDKKKLLFYKNAGDEFIMGGERFRGAASYYPETGEVAFYMADKYSEKELQGYAAHEFTHDAWAKLLKGVSAKDETANDIFSTYLNDEMLQALGEADGITDYSTMYWGGEMRYFREGPVKMDKDTMLAIEETLSEVSRIKYQYGEKALSGVDLIWRDFHSDLIAYSTEGK